MPGPMSAPNGFPYAPGKPTGKTALNRKRGTLARWLRNRDKRREYNQKLQSAAGLKDVLPPKIPE